MAKARKNHKPAKRQPKTKVEATPASAPDGIDVNEAFHLMLAQFHPYAARHRFQEALLTNAVRLLVNGTAVSPDFIAGHLRVSARTEPDGRWIACIEPTRALVPAEYIWTVSRAEVINLLHQKASSRSLADKDKRGDDGPVVSRVKQDLLKLFPPDGIVPEYVASTKVQAQIEAECGWKTSWDSVQRARGRR